MMMMMMMRMMMVIMTMMMIFTELVTNDIKPFYDSHEKMYFHCDVFSIKTGYTIIRCLNSNVKYVV